MLRSKYFWVEILFEGDALNFDSLSMLIIQNNWTVFHSIILDHIRYSSSCFHLPPIQRKEKKEKEKENLLWPWLPTFTNKRRIRRCA